MGVKVDFSELKQFAKDIDRLNRMQREQFFEETTRHLGDYLRVLAISRTPVGEGQKDGEGRTIRQGGALHRGWTASTANQAITGGGLRTSHANGAVERTKRGYYRTIVKNQMHYASYVEYGHRQEPGRYVPAIGKRLTASWVEGQFFLRRSEDELREAAPRLIELKLDAFLKRVF